MLDTGPTGHRGGLVSMEVSACLSGWMWSMNNLQQRRMLEFIHDLNVERLTEHLAAATDESEIKLLLTLLAEEKARFAARLPSTGAPGL